MSAYRWARFVLPAVVLVVLPASVPLATAEPDPWSVEGVRVSGPIPQRAAPGDPSHDYTFYATPFDLRRAGYEELEYFVSGTATRYPPNPTADEQQRAATPIGSMPYTTRIV